MKITQLDYSILGLLSKQSLSGYQVRMTFERTALKKYSSSPGTIYPALQRLQKHGLVEKKTMPGNRSGSFVVSREGLKVLRNWIVQPLTKEDIARGLDMLFLRIAFLDSVDASARRERFFDSVSTSLMEYIGELENFHAQQSSIMPMGGRLAFEHGLHACRETLKWIREVRRAYNSN